jgi:bifunctional non-homologous end joining protein LigD
MKSSWMVIALSQLRTTVGSRYARAMTMISACVTPRSSSLPPPFPDETVIDGEVVAFDETGKPSFNVLQNYGSSPAAIFYYAFDVLVLRGRDVMSEPLVARRALLENRILPKLYDPIRYSRELKASLPDLIVSVKAQGLEGLVAKRRSGVYEPGQRSGSWQKMRVNQGQEFVIGGYTLSDRNFDALIIGYYEEGKLFYAGRTRNGFTPPLRVELMKRLRPLRTETCPFANLPEKRPGRWGQGLTATKMKECRWLKPALVGNLNLSNGPPTFTSATRVSLHSATTRRPLTCSGKLRSYSRATMNRLFDAWL